MIAQAGASTERSPLLLARDGHACLLYDTPSEQMPVLVPYIRDALARGDRFIYVADDLAPEDVTAALVAGGVDVDAEVARGALLIWSREQWRPPGPLDPAATVAQVRQLVADALATGFGGLTCAVEMTWTLQPDIDEPGLGAWEATLDALFGAVLPLRMTCQYSSTRLPGAVVRGALATHPTVILDGHLSANPYYVEPGHWRAEARSRRRRAVTAERQVEWMLSRIRSARTLSEERAARVRVQGQLAAADSARDAMAQEAELFATLHRVGQIVLAELDVEKAIQAVTDEVTPAVGAQFGAFFYNEVREDGEAYQLSTLAGADRARFEQFPMPHATELFGPTFRGEGTVRLHDVREDARFGKHGPHHGLPEGHLPVRSYLAVPVVGRSGEVFGGLFFGHAAPGAFTERAARLAEGVAAQAAIAIENGRLYAEAQQAVKTREQFLGVASHELKTPLTVLKGYALLLQRKLDRGTLTPADLPAITTQLVTHAGRLEELVNDLLETSRIQRGRLDLRREEGELVALVHEVVQRAADDLDVQALHRLVVDAPASLRGSFDALRMDQVLTNLVSNAVKYSPDGGEVRVAVRGSQHGWAEVSVEDHGIGIPAEACRNLFQPFYRVHTDGDAFGGSGLGLYISAQIVEAHGGSIEASSVLGRGSTFTVRLPLAAPARS